MKPNIDYMVWAEDYDITNIRSPGSVSVNPSRLTLCRTASISSSSVASVSLPRRFSLRFGYNAVATRTTFHQIRLIDFRERHAACGDASHIHGLFAARMPAIAFFRSRIRRPVIQTARRGALRSMLKIPGPLQ